MYKMGLLSGSRTKSANVVGQTMKLNPHGDAAIYETMVRLTRGNASLLHPYVDSKGNFGKQYSRDMQFAASRYTEVKLDKICTELFRAIDKDVVTFTPNYDATMQEPTLLPATFPSVLVNANQGIAVGMASNICPFNLREVCSATIAYIKNPDCVIEKYIKGPDFPGGGEFIVDREELAKVFDSGRGTLRLRARYRVDLKNRLIEIYEIPYSTTVEAVLDNLAELVKAGKAKEISDVRDETDLNGLKLTIELKRAAEPEALMNRLFKQTSLQANFACNFNVLIDGRPRVLGVKQLIGEWLNFRRTCVRRETAFDLQEKQAKLHLLEGLNTIMLDIDKAIRIIRETENETDVIPNLCRGFAIDAVQAEYIAEIKLRNLNREYLLKRTADRSELTEEIAQLQNRLASTSLLDAEIIRTLQQVAEKYGQDRRTVLIDAGEITEITGEDLIEDYRLKYFLTAHGYLKKLPLTSLRSAGELKIKDEDEIISEIEAGNRDEIMVFTDQANVYKISGHEIKDCKPSELGEYLPGLLDFDPEEKVIYLHVPGEYVGDFMFAFANGKVARVPVSAYKTKTKRRKLVAAYSDKSPLVGIEFAPENKSYVLISNLSKVLIFDSEQIPAKVTRNNQGVQVMSAKRNSVVNKFSTPEAAGIQDSPYYRTKNLPAIGYYLKEDMVKNRQMTIS